VHIAGIFMEVASSFVRLLFGATLRHEWAGVAIAVEQRAAIVHGAAGFELLAIGADVDTSPPAAPDVRACEERLIARSGAD
jgi:hypothetical protein